jgi:hypothetical protein
VIARILEISTTVVSAGESPAAPESAIARGMSETQYVPAAGRPAGPSLPDIILAGISSNRSTMKNDKDKREGQTGKPEKNPRQDQRQDQRQDRLKLALRENLKRRKSQARGRDDFAGAASNADEASLHDGGEKAPGKQE